MITTLVQKILLVALTACLFVLVVDCLQEVLLLALDTTDAIVSLYPWNW